MANASKPLDGLLVIDLSQFLAGPSAALRLADMGARVIKVERPGTGDICRTLYLTDTEVAGDSTLFHAINRNKESIALDLKQSEDLVALKELIARADVLIQNFRPGVIERLGLGFAEVERINPRLVYGSISGYGDGGPWVDFPGQDLLAQAVSGVMWLNGSAADGPVPIGLPVADIIAGHVLTEGILSALVRRGITGKGALVQTSLLEALVDLQFEALTTYLNDGRRMPQRPEFRGAHAYLAAPYGIYPTSDGYLALAMMPLEKLARELPLPELLAFDSHAAFSQRDTIKRLIAGALAQQSSACWLDLLRTHDIWCAEVLDWPRLLDNPAFETLDILQTVLRGDGTPVVTTRSPMRIDGQRPINTRGAPRVGEQSAELRAEFKLNSICCESGEQRCA